MQLTNLVEYVQDGLELWVDEASGKAYAHMRAIARMLGLDGTNGTLRNRLKGVQLQDVKMAEIPTAGGLQGVQLYPAKVVFKLAMEFNPELAEAMGACGANVYMLGLAGYKVRATEPAPYVDPVTLPAQQSVTIANAIRHITDTLDDNPRLAQILIDNAINTILEKQSKLPSTVEPQLRGVAEIATDMGYKVDQSNRGKLGKFIVSQGFEPQKEARLCNGVSRPINCYPDTPELREAIANYFN
jgi:hypothetical protein